MTDIEKKLRDLPQIAEKQLGGIEAKAGLKYKILSTLNEKNEKKTFSFPKLSIALGTLSTFCILFVIGFMVYPTFIAPVTPPVEDDIPKILVQHSAAGHNDQTLPQGQERASLLLDIPQGSMSISPVSPTNSSSLWVSGGNNFPLIGEKGKYFRQMTGVSFHNLQAATLGSIEEFVQEPTLSQSQGLISNVVLEDEEVYALKNINNSAMIAAYVNGVLTPFQRISFAGNAIVDGESFQSTLGFSPADVQSITLSGVGTITDSAKAQELVAYLFNKASYLSPSLGSGEKLFHIQLNSGLTLQLYADEDTFSACGSWSVPGFTQLFEEALQ